MRTLKRFGASAATLSMLLALTLSAVSARAQVIQWKNIVGTRQTFDLVGVGTGQVMGAAPWVTTNGTAKVYLVAGNASFQVSGLVLAVGSVPAVPLSGLLIGTAAGVTKVKGTLVCNVSGTTSGSTDSVEVDTSPVALDNQGDAQFNGSFVSSVPTICSAAPWNTAFLIRIVEPAADADLYIAFGAVLFADQ